MKPAPFDKKYEYREPSSGRRVVSTEAFGTKVFDSDGTTEIYTIPGCFSGRRTISLSSDGATLIFDGNYYFGDSFLRTPDIDDDEVVTVIYHQGYVWKEVCFKTDLNKGEVLDLYERISVYGGGWLTRKDVISKTEIDWVKGMIVYTMTTQKDATITSTRDIELPRST